MKNVWITSRRALQAGIVIFALGSLVRPVLAGKLRAEIGPGADFARYKTYEWLPTRVLTGSGVVENDPVLTPLIKEAINRQLTQRGLVEVAQGGDLQVSAGALTASIPQLEAVVFAGPAMTYGTPIANMGRYNKEGTLIVNLIDTRTKKYAWIGMVQESIDNKPGGGQKKIAPAAARLFKKYPTGK